MSNASIEPLSDKLTDEVTKAKTTEAEKQKAGRERKERLRLLRISKLAKRRKSTIPNKIIHQRGISKDIFPDIDVSNNIPTKTSNKRPSMSIEMSSNPLLKSKPKRTSRSSKPINNSKPTVPEVNKKQDPKVPLPGEISSISMVVSIKSTQEQI